MGETQGVSETILAPNPGKDTMAALNTKEPAALNVGRHIEARHARMTAAQSRQAKAPRTAETGTLGVVVGVLGAVETKNGRNGPYLRATLTRTVDGVEQSLVALVSARAMDRAAAHFVAGPVRLYGEVRATTVSVIGPALARRLTTAKTGTRAAAGNAGAGSKGRPTGWWFARKAAQQKRAAPAG